jgi:hypothetical protein
MPLLSAASVRAKRDWKTKDITVPEWEGEVRVRSLSLRDRLAVQALSDVREQVPQLLAMSLIDEEGNRLFGPDQLEDLAGKDSVPCLRLFDELVSFNGMGKKDVQAAEKNSATTSPAASPSA